METRRPPMTCPGCGEAMNHHARKRVQTVEPLEAALVDPDLGGVIHEAHACPGCGHAASRPALPRPLPGIQARPREGARPT